MFPKVTFTEWSYLLKVGINILLYEDSWDKEIRNFNRTKASDDEELLDPEK
jgi:hypothetical protein